MALFVRASNGIGSVSVALEDPREALRSIGELKEAGFKKIGVFDLTGHEVDVLQLGASLSEGGGPPGSEADQGA